MNEKKKLGYTTVAAIAATSALTIAMPATAELSASAAVSNMYLFRGENLGSGDAAVSGDLVYSHESGLSGGVWATSAAFGPVDGDPSSEYDLFIDYTTEVNDITLGAAIWTYVYPEDSEENFLDLSELILTGGIMGITGSYVKNIAGDSEYDYWSLGYSYEKYSATIGRADNGGDDDGFTHLDISYAYNDNLSFTLSAIVDEEEDDTKDTDAKWVVTYSVPIQ